MKMSQNFVGWMRSGENCLLICGDWIEEIRKKVFCAGNRNKLKVKYLNKRKLLFGRNIKRINLNENNSIHGKKTQG